MHDLRPATEALATLAHRVDDSQLGAPTPCPDYTVGDLLDHIGRLAVAFSEAARKERGTNADPPGEGSAANLAADWRTRIPADLATLGDAWADPDAWEGNTTIAGMEMPARVVGAVALNEVVTHAWDLARGIGQPYDADRETIAGCMEFIGPLSQAGAASTRGPAFGPVVVPSDDASPMDRLVAFTGRDPGWTAR